MAPSSGVHHHHSFGRIAIPSSTCSPTHRRQCSLESILDFQHQALLIHQRTLAEKLLTHILDICVSPSTTQGFDHVSLLQLSLEYNPSLQGRDNFLNFVLRYYLPADDGGYQDTGVEDSRFGIEFSKVLEQLDKTVWTWKETLPKWVIDTTVELADHFVYYFFLPMKGQAAKTPQPTPHLTPVCDPPHTPTTNRLKNLRASCLIRDRHRCMVSGLFDMATAQGRNPFVDDDGSPLSDGDVICTEVAHIIPHALAEPACGDSSLGSESPEQKATFWEVMKLFNPRAEQMLNGVEIDRPFNAMTLAIDLHRTFGGLEWYLDTDDIEPQPNTYIFKPSPSCRRLILNPIFRPPHPRGRVSFTNANDNTTDLPDAGLLALHRACAIILGLSGAGEYIERLLRDEEELNLGKMRSELQRGEVNLGGLVSWQLGLKV